MAQMVNGGSERLTVSGRRRFVPTWDQEGQIFAVSLL